MSEDKLMLHKAQNIEIEKLSHNLAKISVYPFESGYAITLAHPLRRLLMSSSVGYAPIALRIDGVDHEFDSLNGMLEDVAIFVLNLKTIRFKIKDENKDMIDVRYSFEKAGQITGKDLINDEIDVVNPDQELANINKNCKLNFTVIIKKGISYTPSEETRSLVGEDYIPLDAFFTPVRNVVYDIENMLVDDNPNFEKIIFKIKTDGQISPTDALKEAVSTMYKQMSVFNKVFTLEDIDISPKDSVKKIDLKNLVQPIDELELSARSFNSLERAGITYIGEVVLKSEVEVENIKNLGKKSLMELSDKLKEIGYPIDETLDEDIASALRKKLSSLKTKQGE